MNNKKIYYSILAILLLILVVSTTYAFFAPQAGGTTSTNAIVTSNTTDLLTFSINRDISFTVTQNDFQENGTNQSGDATATATLTPNNKTGAATMNYYLYLNIEENPITYSEANTNGLPELMLQVFDGSNQLVTLSDLGNQVTVKGVTGYDITAIEGPITLLDNHAISASNNTATIENWRIVITLINHDFNQNDNTGKEVSAEIIIQKDELDLGFTGTIYRNDFQIALIGHPIYDTSAVLWNQNNSSDYYSSQAACEQYYASCSSTTTTIGIGSDYDTEPVQSSWYLKHEVVNDIIQSVEVCLTGNDYELCLEPDYWVGDAQDQIDGSTTKTKLQNEIQDEWYTANINCESYDNFAMCSFSGYNCTIHNNGFTSCGDYYGDGGCWASSDGTSYCY